MRRIPIIYYHEVVPDGQGYSYQKIDECKFARQMQVLHDSGYQSLMFSELDAPIPEKPVIVSFDDGFQSVCDRAQPIMERYGIRGNIYLPTARLGSSNVFMDWDTVRTLFARGDWFFAAHTHTHKDIRSFTPETAKGEIEASHSMFRQMLGYEPDVFCIPYGTYTRKSAAMVQKAGKYRLMLGSFYGFADLSASERRVLPRIGISNDDTDEAFTGKLNGKYNWKGPLQRLRLAADNLAGRRIEHYQY